MGDTWETNDPCTNSSAEISPPLSCSAHLLGRSRAHHGLVSLPTWHVDFLLFLQLVEILSGFYLFISGFGDRGMVRGIIDDLSQTKPNFLCFPEPFIILSACCHFFLESGWPGSAQSQRSGIFPLRSLPTASEQGLLRGRCP